MPNVLRALLQGENPSVPIGELLGFTVASIGAGRAAIEMAVSHRHANPMGSLHGGVLCDIADAAMGLAYASTIAEGESFTTLDLKINFFRPVWNGQLQAAATVVKSGRTVGYMECDITDEEERLVAKASSTCMTLRGETAEGR